jgi:hypothetical protein
MSLPLKSETHSLDLLACLAELQPEMIADAMKNEKRK